MLVVVRGVPFVDRADAATDHVNVSRVALHLAHHETALRLVEHLHLLLGEPPLVLHLVNQLLELRVLERPVQPDARLQRLDAQIQLLDPLGVAPVHRGLYQCVRVPIP